MANIVNYENQVWGEPLTCERHSTNGHYTGEHMGSVTQDAKHEMTAHIVEANTVRLGTITQDAIEGSTPAVAD